MMNKPLPPAKVRQSRVSARLRITGWILLTAAIALVAVSATARSISQLEITQEANEAVAQESAEFVRFAETGSNPNTGGSFESVDQMLQLYIHRQSLTTGESLMAVVDESVVAAEGASTAWVRSGTSVTVLRQELRQVLGSTATSG